MMSRIWEVIEISDKEWDILCSTILKYIQIRTSGLFWRKTSSFPRDSKFSHPESYLLRVQSNHILHAFEISDDTV